MINFDDFLRSYISSQETKTVSIDNGCSLFICDLTKTRRPSSILYYKDHLKPFIEFARSRDVKFFNEIDNKFILAYAQNLKYRGNENQTINKRLSLLKMVMTYLNTNGYISNFELIFPKYEVKQKEIKVISEIQIKQLLEYAKSQLTDQPRLIIILLISTGIRRNELINILVKNIDFDNFRIYLDYTKNKKARYIWFDSETSILIKRVLEKNAHNTYLFENSLGNQLKPAYVTQLLYYIKKRLNFSVLSPHKLRHTYATYLLKNGANQEEVRRLLGHSDFKMTKRYIDYLDTDLQEANRKYNPLNLMKGKK